MNRNQLALLCVMALPVFCAAAPNSAPKADSATQARIDSIPADSNRLFTEVPEWKPYMDSAFSSYFEKQGKNFQWKKIRYPLKLSRKYFDSKLKKNRLASKNKGHRLSRPVDGEEFEISEDRTIEVELFGGEKVVLVCDSIRYDGLIWGQYLGGARQEFDWKQSLDVF